MKAAYVNHPLSQAAIGVVYLALVSPNNFSHAQSPEARQVREAAERVQRHWNERALSTEGQRAEDLSYNHLSPRPVSSVKCQYKYVGRMNPRQFPLDE
jgi:hypothetical protein